ncbi:MAG: phosphonate degradation HD-domain oxygenase [Pseudomonadota bacterium]|nr:phosphonate degradation HD-domain oxygenase [Pseudomonadota bacterium]
MVNTVDEVMDLLARKGAEQYGGEAVSQLQHALQCAHQAEREGEPATLVAACLLHDIGHMLGAGDEGQAARGVDARHEESAARWLARRFVPAVTEPVRLHVAAKRWLCQAEPGYRDSLSEASKLSLAVQGGIYSADEADAFIAQDFAPEATRLRRYDDCAKDPAAVTPDLEHFRAALDASLKVA